MKTLLVFCTLVFSIGAFAQKDIQRKIQTQLIDATDGSVIDLPAGCFQFDASLSLDDKKNVIIKGAGMDKTILSFNDMGSPVNEVFYCQGPQRNIEGKKSLRTFAN